MTAPSGDAYATLRDALSTDANGGKTARELAAATGIGYSRVTELLREMHDDGTAAKEKSGRQVTWTRREDTHTSGSGEAVAMSVDGPIVTDETDGSYDTPEPAESDSAADHDGTPTDPPAEDGRTASDALTGADDPEAADGTYPLTPDAPVVALEDATSAADVLGAMTAVRPIPEAPAKVERAPRAARTSVPVRERDVKRDHQPGELRQRILDYAGTQSDPFTPSQVANALHAHAGSVTFTLGALVKKDIMLAVGVKGRPLYRLNPTPPVTPAPAGETAAEAPAA